MRFINCEMIGVLPDGRHKMLVGRVFCHELEADHIPVGCWAELAKQDFIEGDEWLIVRPADKLRKVGPLWDIVE